MRDKQPGLNKNALIPISHDTPERHVYGEALLVPNSVSSVGNGIVSSIGSSNASAREDHIHGMFSGSSGFRNKFQNGDFRVRQLGDSFSTTGYTADNVLLNVGTGGSSLLNFTDIVNDIDGLFSTYASWVISAMGTTETAITFRVPDVRVMNNKPITCSFFCNNGGGPLDAYILQFFGTGGGESGFVVSAPIRININGTTAVTRYSVTFPAMPVTGKTIGANNNSNISFQLNRPIASGTTSFSIWGVQVEVGPVLTPYEQYPVGMAEMLCRRQLIRLDGSGGQTFMVGIANGTTNVTRFTSNLPVSMTRNPGLTLTGGVVYDGNANYGIVGINANYSNRNIVNFDLTTTSAVPAGRPCQLNTAILDIDARF